MDYPGVAQKMRNRCQTQQQQTPSKTVHIPSRYRLNTIRIFLCKKSNNFAHSRSPPKRIGSIDSDKHLPYTHNSSHVRRWSETRFAGTARKKAVLRGFRVVARKPTHRDQTGWVKSIQHFKTVRISYLTQETVICNQLLKSRERRVNCFHSVVVPNHQIRGSWNFYRDPQEQLTDKNRWVRVTFVWKVRNRSRI